MRTVETLEVARHLAPPTCRETGLIRTRFRIALVDGLDAITSSTSKMGRLSSMRLPAAATQTQAFNRRRGTSGCELQAKPKLRRPHKMPESVIPGLVAGLFALLGAFAGSALSRRSEYEKCLRQERTQAFGILVKELYETRLYATVVYYDEPGTEQEKSMKVTEAFTRLQKHLSIARLFMSESSREKLSELVNQLWLNCTAQGGPANRVIQNEELMKQIQSVLEQDLNYLPWRVRWPLKKVFIAH